MWHRSHPKAIIHPHENCLKIVGRSKSTFSRRNIPFLVISFGTTAHQSCLLPGYKIDVPMLPVCFLSSSFLELNNCQPALCGYFSVYFVLLDESNLTLLILPSTQLGHGTGPWLATHSSPKSWLYNLLEWLDPSGLISHVLRLLLCIYEFLWITI